MLVSRLWHRCFSALAAVSFIRRNRGDQVRIQHVNREIVVETSESAADVEKELLTSIAVGGDGVFTLSDERGRKVLIPVNKIAYVDLGEENARHVGFGAV